MLASTPVSFIDKHNDIFFHVKQTQMCVKESCFNLEAAKETDSMFSVKTPLNTTTKFH